MTIENVLAKFDLNKPDLSAFELETALVLTNIYNTPSGEIFLEKFVNDPRDFSIKFEDDTAHADFVSGPNGLEPTVFIDFSWIPEGTKILTESGVASAMSAEVILTHELTHLLLSPSTDPDGFDISALLNPDTNRGEMVIQENLVAGDLTQPQRLSINAGSILSSGFQSLAQLVEGRDYTPGADSVDVIFVEGYYYFGGIDLSQHSPNYSYLLVMGDDSLRCP